jgi:hypothetical protein
MDELFARWVTDLTGRVTGPMAFRLLLQPGVATMLAVRDGLADARQRRPAFFWGLLSDPAHRREMVSSGWVSIAKLFTVAVVLDIVYQGIALRWFYPGEALVVATLLAIVPYLLLRGAVNRMFRNTGSSAKKALRS